MASRKCTNICIPKYFMAVRMFINTFVLVEVLSMVWSDGRNPSSISQQFNWSHQLIIDCFGALLEVPSMIWKRFRPSSP